MTEFLTLLPPSEALARYLKQISFSPETEIIPTSEAVGRVTGCAYYAPHPLPTFRRSTVDGYAVRARDTYGASETLPVYLRVVDEVAMGSQSQQVVNSGECVLIHTGGMLPEEADSIIMLENTQSAQPGEIEVYRGLAVGENIINVGEDIQTGMEVLSAGRRLRPSEIGGLMALGIISIQVFKRPRVGILSSGDEIIPAEQDLTPGKVRDVNAYTLASLVGRAGGVPINYGIASDKEEDLYEKASRAFSECDMLVITAGSSVSTRDLTARVIQRLGEPGVIVHGVNIRPGKPTILGVCDNKPVIGLPGNPVSALVIASLFVIPIVERLGGSTPTQFQATISATLTINLSSQAGREEWVAVRLIKTPEGIQAEPIFGKSNLIFTLVRADGLIRIEADATGLPAGSIVDVHLL
jgi:molybdopterin molybdotransferase